VGNSTQVIYAALSEINSRYASDLVLSDRKSGVPRLTFYVPRTAFHVRLVAGTTKARQASICDVGGGVGPFAVGCAALGMKVTLVDDFHDSTHEEHGDSSLNLHRSLGVRVVRRDVVADGLDFPPSVFDVVTCFDSLEHWHHSPKRVLHNMFASLVPGGLFIVSVPNCVNLRKRITVPLGYGRWSPIESWYDTPVFRGHVREPDTKDLRYIARDLGLTNVKILGRNWLGLASQKRSYRVMANAVDMGLRFFPGLCSNLYLIGTKPESTGLVTRRPA
jgi:SAM-dependent methyltransferase